LPDPEFSIIPPNPRAHSEPLADLCAKVFSDMGYYELMEDYRTVYLRNSHYDWAVSRVGVIGDRIVTHFGVWDYQMRIGTARVRVGGVGAVATDGEFRRRGYMAQAASASMEAMREAGYDFAILFGISDLYHRFGYVRAWPETDFRVRTGDLPEERPAGRLRRFTPRPRLDLAELYNRHYATVTGTAVRPTYPKGYPLFLRPRDGYLWADGRGRTAGYVLVTRHGSRLDCVECCGEAEQALRVLGVLARKWNCDNVQLETLPYFSDLAKLLRRGNCRVEARYHKCGGAMMQMLNLHRALSKMRGELSRRLRRSLLADWEGDLLIADPRGEVCLHLQRGKVTVAPPGRTAHCVRGDGCIGQLLLGTDEPNEVVDAARMRLTGKARKLVEVLFPEQRPQLGTLDRY